MKIWQIDKDVESAYGSDSTSNSSVLLKKEQFTIQESTGKKEIWYKWMKDQMREYMIFEGLFLVILLFLLFNSFRISSENQQIQIMISNLQSQFEQFQKQQSSNNNLNQDSQASESTIKERKIIEETVTKILEEVKPIAFDRDVPEVVHQPVELKKSEENYGKTQNVPLKKSSYQFNAASLIDGGSIDSSHSSISNLNPSFGLDQSSLVVLDRTNPPSDKMWCSDEKEPVLTVNLAKYINPISVSYQHFDWNGTIPNGTPKIFDVFTCFDYYCENTRPLISNCHYDPSRFDKNKEQIYRIPSTFNTSSVGKVQFRFRENHGNVERTCVSLVRVYGETNETPKIKEKSLRDAATCSDLKYSYHNSYIKYQFFNFKDCKTLYSTRCCSECPECCDNCWIQDVEPLLAPIICIIIFFLFVFLLAALCGICAGVISMIRDSLS